MTEPITPDEVKVALKPDEVTQVFNELIQKYWNGSEATIKQDEIAKLIAKRMGISEKDLFDKHYLDIEELYRQNGWVVVYDKPAYNESYPPIFTFSKQ